MQSFPNSTTEESLRNRAPMNKYFVGLSSLCIKILKKKNPSTTNPISVPIYTARAYEYIDPINLSEKQLKAISFKSSYTLLKK